MVLTEEQRKRMEESRKRALEIKRKKQIEKETNEKSMAMASGKHAPSNVFEAGGFVGKSEEVMESESKKRRINEEVSGDAKRGAKMGSKGKGNINSNVGDANNEEDDESSLEDFEINASPYISKTEAQRLYCIPLGTLEVCSYIEKDNPHKRGWSKMKLYHRAELRRRGRNRFGGKEGLVVEREKRKKKRFAKDLKETEDVFR